MNIKNLLLTGSFMFCLNVVANNPSDPLDLKSDYQFEAEKLKCAKLKDEEGWIPDIEKISKKANENQSDFLYEAVSSLFKELDSILSNLQDKGKIEKIHEIASSLKGLSCNFPEEECDTLSAMGYSLVLRLLAAGNEGALWDLQEGDLIGDCLKYVQLAETSEALPNGIFFNMQREFQNALENVSKSLDAGEVRQILNNALQEAFRKNSDSQEHPMEEDISDDVVPESLINSPESEERKRLASEVFSSHEGSGHVIERVPFTVEAN